ncbi:hypothetical protein [Phenylobacterium sp.]|uniref:hypothetical protein n=1 Tax=Phenylobacterium sp. TaxID=1871053 RepID=UPI0025CB7F18|nr:hypothetical protein [Phenylobacterium sp.]MBX3482553.1 hypothetical protein [Phenylobacterium sp.]MCW5758761.1 hypothetical protein [Phenylobacterium sp.]
MTPTHFRHEGRSYPLSARFVAEHCRPWPHLAELTEAEIDAGRRKIAAIGDRRQLTDEECTLKQAMDLHHAARVAVRLLAGRPLSDFGMEGYDEVHGNRIRYRCGCALDFIFNHYDAAAGATPGNGLARWWHTPFHVCRRHSRFRADLDHLAWEVEIDNGGRGRLRSSS